MRHSRNGLRCGDGERDGNSSSGLASGVVGGPGDDEGSADVVTCLRQDQGGDVRSPVVGVAAKPDREADNHHRPSELRRPASVVVPVGDPRSDDHELSVSDCARPAFDGIRTTMAAP